MKSKADRAVAEKLVELTFQMFEYYQMALLDAVKHARSVGANETKAALGVVGLVAECGAQFERMALDYPECDDRMRAFLSKMRSAARSVIQEADSRNGGPASWMN